MAIFYKERVKECMKMEISQIMLFELKTKYRYFRSYRRVTELLPQKPINIKVVPLSVVP